MIDDAHQRAVHPAHTAHTARMTGTLPSRRPDLLRVHRDVSVSKTMTHVKTAGCRDSWPPSLDALIALIAALEHDRVVLVSRFLERLGQERSPLRA